MSKLLPILLVFFANNLLAMETCKQVRISAHPSYPPFHWKDGDTLTGASIDISVEILKTIGVTPIVSYEGPWKRVLKKAELGKIDLIPALKKTEDRSEYLNYTDSPFYSNPVAVFVTRDFDKPIHSLSDLSGLRGSISLGDKHGELIDAFIMSLKNIDRVYTMKSNFEMLRLKRTDYFMQGLYTGNDFLHLSGQKEIFRVAKTFDANWVHMGFSKSSPCQSIIKPFDQQLSKMLKAGDIEKRMRAYEEKWLSSKPKHP